MIWGPPLQETAGRNINAGAGGEGIYTPLSVKIPFKQISTVASPKSQYRPDFYVLLMFSGSQLSWYVGSKEDQSTSHMMIWDRRLHHLLGLLAYIYTWYRIIQCLYVLLVYHAVHLQYMNCILFWRIPYSRIIFFLRFFLYVLFTCLFIHSFFGLRLYV